MQKKSFSSHKEVKKLPKLHAGWREVMRALPGQNKGWFYGFPSLLCIKNYQTCWTYFFHFLGDSDIDQLFHIVKCLGDKSHPDAKEVYQLFVLNPFWTICISQPKTLLFRLSLRSSSRFNSKESDVQVKFLLVKISSIILLRKQIRKSYVKMADLFFIIEWYINCHILGTKSHSWKNAQTPSLCCFLASVNANPVICIQNILQALGVAQNALYWC